MALPEGFGFPPLPYLLAILVAVVGAGGLLLRERPRVTEPVVLAFGPWMVVGAALHALYQMEAAPALIDPLLGTPAVYLTTFALAGYVWALAAAVDAERVPSILGGVGALGVLPAAGAVLAAGGQLRPWLSVGSVAAAVVLTGVGWLALSRASPEATATTGSVGVLVVFAHALDGASTAVGADLLAFDERTPLSAAILEFAGSLPTADLIGVGWLFVLVKLGLAAAIVHLFVDFVREDPEQAYLLLSLVIAVGLGPGVQNVLLFAVG